jgi:hypothetical protein
MRSTTPRAELAALFQPLGQAPADHHANARVEAYAPDAVLDDLAPPRGRCDMHRASVTARLAGGEGPMQIDARSVHLPVAGN